jgi:trans-aconitate 2-methyltransferase
MRYTFGTSQTAARRLQEISHFFNPPAHDFIVRFLDKTPEGALDLGCGPGFTTRMLKQATGCNRVYGLDRSEEFLALAGKQYPGLTFISHDITKVPFPVHADIGYTRFVLAHLKDVVKIINNWAGELQGGGLLFIEEVEDIFTDVPVFNAYLSANRGLVASQGARLYVGELLGTAKYEHDVVYNESVLLPVPDHRAASWFFPNTVSIWKQEEYIKNNLSEADCKNISGELERIMNDKNENESRITWKMRRLVVRKRSHGLH